jgi:Xaa-Pro aminopeptidase
MSLSPTVFDHVEDRIEYAELSEATKVFHDMRRIKTDEEVRRLRKATEINETAIEDAVKHLEEGMTEQEFADIFCSLQCKQGAKPGHTNIAFGQHTEYAHAIPGDRELEAGDLIRFEVGIEYQHYPADLARTYAFKSATDDAKQRYQVIREGLKRAEEMMVDGASTTEVHNAAMDRARETASDVGADALTEWTRRHIGHNMGLDVHDHPLLSPTMREFGDDTLRAGMVMNYEAAHLILESGGVQIEDTALVTENGIEAFSNAPDELPVVE